MLYLFLERAKLTPLSLFEQCVAVLLESRPRANLSILFRDLENGARVKAHCAALDRVDLPQPHWRQVGERLNLPIEELLTDWADELPDDLSDTLAQLYEQYEGEVIEVGWLSAAELLALPIEVTIRHRIDSHIANLANGLPEQLRLVWWTT